MKEVLRDALEKALHSLKVKTDIRLEHPPSLEFGHFATNVALQAARELKKSPRDVALLILEALPKTITNKFETSIAGPGFINFKATPVHLQGILKEILVKKDKAFAFPKKKEKINLEFLSTNPTGPATLANGRGGFFGDVLGNVLTQVGYKVHREFYINDGGNQMKMLGSAVRASLGLIPDHEEYYHGTYVADWAKEHAKDVTKRLEAPPEEEGRIFADYILAHYIKPVVGKRGMRIAFDTWFSEYRELHQKKKVAKVKEELIKKGLTYEAEGALWLKTTLGGDDKDRVIVTKEGVPTYFLVDIAYLMHKIGRKFNRGILILGADHHGYVPRLYAVAALLGHKDWLRVLITQFVRLIKNGEEFKMSKRRGTYVAMDELLDEVGHDAARFFFLLHALNTHMDFDADLAKKKSSQNPVFYVKYAHARMASIVKKARTRARFDVKKVDYSLLSDPHELELVFELSKLKDLVGDIAETHDVHKLSHYAISLADKFHRFYEHCRVITDDRDLTRARLSVLLGTKLVLKKTLDIIGIEAPDRM